MHTYSHTDTSNYPTLLQIIPHMFWDKKLMHGVHASHTAGEKIVQSNVKDGDAIARRENNVIFY